MTLLADRPTVATPQQAPRPGRAELRRRARRAGQRVSLIGRYLGYSGYFVGAGLISGGLVHYPLDPSRYAQIAGIGVVVFLAATVLNEFVLAEDRPAVRRMLMVIGASLMLSLGIGMLSGGLQHFGDFPERGAMLVPLGMVVSFVAFVLKDKDISARRIFGPVGLVVLVVAVVSFFGLRQVAAGMAESSGEGGHSHGTSTSDTTEDEHSETEDERSGKESAEQEQPAADASPSASPSASSAADEEVAHEEDGHAH